MYTEDEREELCEVFADIVEMARDHLKRDQVIPSRITLNRETVGMTVEFRKIYQSESSDD